MRALVLLEFPLVPGYIGLSLVFVVILLLGVRAAFRDTLIRFKMNRLTKKPIGLVGDGELCRITGKICETSDLIIAPLSGRSCVFYRIVVEENDDGWKTITEEERMSQVMITDGKDYAALATNDLEVYLTGFEEYSSGFGKDATAAMDRFLEAKGKSSTTFIGLNRALRYREYILVAGHEIALAGCGTWKSVDGAAISGSTRRVLTFNFNKRRSVYLSDDSKILN